MAEFSRRGGRQEFKCGPLFVTRQTETNKQFCGIKNFQEKKTILADIQNYKIL